MGHPKSHPFAKARKDGAPGDSRSFATANDTPPWRDKPAPRMGHPGRGWGSRGEDGAPGTRQYLPKRLGRVFVVGLCLRGQGVNAVPVVALCALKAA